MQALILAGGFGTRLRPLTLNLPKPAVPLVNRPILAYQIELLKRAGITDIILSLNYQPDKIQEVIGNGEKCGVQIKYVVEPEPLGTAGAVKFAEEFINQTTVILNGDNLINLDIAKVTKYHREQKAVATIVLQKLENPIGYGLVEIDAENRVLDFLEKPSAEDLMKISTRTVNAGTYVLEPSVLDLIPKNENYSFEYGVFPALLKRSEKFLAFVDDSYWLDVGTPPRYLFAHQEIINHKVSGFSGEDFRAESDISPNAEICPNSIIGKGCIIKNGAKIENSVLGENVLVGENSIVKDSVILAETHLGEKVSITGSIIGKNCKIGSNSTISPETVLGEASVLTDYSKV
ncbi:MAG TPA: NDP-sugar synthase [Pyrinomonadaceae bacterium]|nr:NDP-sugar synthase [Pyrinomonadaceae bacterium]